MSVLTHDKIIDEVANGKIKITPYSENAVGPGSVDLTLGDKIRIFEKEIKDITLSENIDYLSITKEITISNENPYSLAPREMVIGITAENVTLSGNYSAWIEGRSRFARAGLIVHVSSGFIQPGTSCQQVLEIVNLGPAVIKLVPGVKICQIVIDENIGEAVYSGKFKDQQDP